MKKKSGSFGTFLIIAGLILLVVLVIPRKGCNSEGPSSNSERRHEEPKPKELKIPSYSFVDELLVTLHPVNWTRIDFDPSVKEWNQNFFNPAPGDSIEILIEGTGGVLKAKVLPNGKIEFHPKVRLPRMKFQLVRGRGQYLYLKRGSFH